MHSASNCAVKSHVGVPTLSHGLLCLYILHRISLLYIIIVALIRHHSQCVAIACLYLTTCISGLHFGLFVVDYRLVCTMVHKCAAYSCRSGYKGDVSDIKVSFHSFPLNNEELCDRRMKANPRKDFVSTKHSKLCSLHFRSRDFVDEHRESNQQ